MNLKRAAYVILTVGMPSSLSAGYTSNCAYSASDLESAAHRYESEKSSYEGACSSYGYSRDDESACRSYGYVTSSYRDPAERLKRAIREVYDSCGAPDDNRQYIRVLTQAKKEITELEKRLADTEKELEYVRSKGAENLPPPRSVPDQPTSPIPAQSFWLECEIVFCSFFLPQ
jgi:hypothetical protein